MAVAQRTVMRLMRGIVANCVTKTAYRGRDVSSAQMIPLNASPCIIRLASCSDATFRPVLILIHRPVSVMFFRTESWHLDCNETERIIASELCFFFAVQAGLRILIAPNWSDIFVNFYSRDFSEKYKWFGNGLLFAVDLIYIFTRTKFFWGI